MCTRCWVATARQRRRLVFDAADRGEPVQQLYLQILQPALREIGRLWQLQKISVAQEHFCSVATQIVMSQLLLRVPAAKRCGRGVVVACVSGDLHELGARMVGDFFEMAGWDTYFCGANTPHAAVVHSVVERKADVLAVSATMGYHLHAVQELIELVRADPRCATLRVMVGGHPFTVDPALWRTVGADGTAADADAAVALAGQWLARPASADCDRRQREQILQGTTVLVRRGRSSGWCSVGTSASVRICEAGAAQQAHRPVTTMAYRGKERRTRFDP